MLADTAMSWSPGGVKIFQNSAYLEPVTGSWVSTPTNHFRHQGRTQVLCGDGHAQSFDSKGATVNPEHSMPVGDRCESDADCATGICVKEEQGQYCSRPCTVEGPCPDEFRCVGDEPICRVIRPPAPLVYKRGESDGCNFAHGPHEGHLAWLALGMGLSLLLQRRRSA